jgi:murein DD-endopeptidase MepM/ murein hydrolase activator NlpD
MPSETQDAFLYGFLLAIPQGAPPGKLAVVAKGSEAGGAEGGRGFEISSSIDIEAKTFAREDIPLDSANTAIRTAPDPAKTAESAVFAKVFAFRDPTAVYAKGALSKPIENGWRETAGFGDMRRYLYSAGGSDTTTHGGVDIGAKEGTPVLACAAGRVVFVARRIVTGNTIVIEHLPGFFSIYMHLSAVEVSEGKVVEQGQRIGKVGSTGLSTGPHLHWELRIGEVSVNPYRYLERPLLDKNAVSSRIKPPMEGR